MRRSAAVRLAWLIIATLQLALPGAAAWADARLERESASPRAAVHVEQAGGSHCPRVHPADCALCQHLATPLARASVPALGVGAPGQSERPRSAVAVPRSRAQTRLPSSRAPPHS